MNEIDENFSEIYEYWRQLYIWYLFSHQTYKTSEFWLILLFLLQSHH